MRAIMAVVALITFGGVIWAGLWLWDRLDARRKYAGPQNVGAARLAQLMARHLDRALADPMYRQSTQWEEEARNLVTNYYGKELRG